MRRGDTRVNKYAQSALRAVQLLRAGMHTPESVWQHAVAETFPDSEDSRMKSCPRGAFLGLCRAGLIEGVPHDPAAPVDEGLNAGYARCAVELLRSEPQWASKKAGEIWQQVMERVGTDPQKRSNAQMDVVLALWKAGVIRR